MNKSTINYKKNVNNTLASGIAQVLVKLGYKNANGLMGTSMILLYEAFINNPNMNCVVFRNESNAGFSALGSVRACKMNISAIRNLSLAFAIQGPGIANMMNSMCDAFMEEIPALFITHQYDGEYNTRQIQNANPNLLYKNAVKVFLNIDKNNYKYYDFLILNAIKKAFTEPMGPILINVHNSVLSLKVSSPSNYNIFYDNGLSVINPKTKFIKSYNKKFDKIINHLKKAKRPLIIIGYGCNSFAHDLLRALHNSKIPYIGTLPMAQYMNHDDELCAIRMGHTSTISGCKVATNSDVILFLASSHNIYTTLNTTKPFSNKKIIMNINLKPFLYNTPYVNINIQEDVRKIIPLLNKLEYNEVDRNKWLEQIKIFKNENLQVKKCLFGTNMDSPLKNGDIFEALNIKIKTWLNNNQKNHIYIVTDVGQHQPFTASYINFSERVHFITEGKWASVGCGLGNAIGCAQCCPDDQVILLSGDGGACDWIGDTITIKESNLSNLSIIIFDNCGYGLITEESIETYHVKLEYSNGTKYFPKFLEILNGFQLETMCATKRKHAFEFSNSIFNNKCKGLVAIVSSTQLYIPVLPIGCKLSDKPITTCEKDNKLDKCRREHLC